MSAIEKFRLDGRKAFITGGAGGIGKSIARALAEAGADVAIVDIPEKSEKAQSISREIASVYGVNSIALAADVADPQQVDVMVQRVVDAFGTVNLVFNSAGVITAREFDQDIDYSVWKRNIEINLCGTFLAGRAAARVMIKSGQGGSIINTASMSGLIINEEFASTPAGSAYYAAKAGVIQLTKSQAVQWVQYNIRVNSISPGYILSGIHNGWTQDRMDYRATRIPMKRFGEVDELQGAVLYLASDASTYTTGMNMIIDGGYTCW
jgi:NAD(P)-dependent dehydrogenase (short-subunit alcohol dehydrogenase family)